MPLLLFLLLSLLLFLSLFLPVKGLFLLSGSSLFILRWKLGTTFCRIVVVHYGCCGGRVLSVVVVVVVVSVIIVVVFAVAVIARGQMIPPRKMILRHHNERIDDIRLYGGEFFFGIQTARARGNMRRGALEMRALNRVGTVEGLRGRLGQCEKRPGGVGRHGDGRI